MSVWLPVCLTVFLIDEQWFNNIIELLLLSMYFMWLKGRPQETDTNQEAFVHDSPGTVQSFLDAVNTIKPTAIIGKELLIFYIHLTSKPLSTVYSVIFFFF